MPFSECTVERLEGKYEYSYSEGKTEVEWRGIVGKRRCARVVFLGLFMDELLVESV